MDKRRDSLRYRPGVGGIGLEDRVVLSHNGTEIGLWGFRHFLVGNDTEFLRRQYQLPDRSIKVTTLANVNAAIRSGYGDLITSVGGASSTFLAGLSSSNARATFDTAVKGALDALTAELTSQLALIGPGGGDIRTMVQQLILGGSPTSLASVLSKLETPPTGTGTNATAFNNKINNAIAVSREQVIGQVDTFLNSRHLSARTFDHTTSTGSVATVSSVAKQNRAYIQTAFAGFNNDYASAAGKWLTSTADIATNRADFDLNTQSAANSLAATLSSELALSPGTAVLIPTIQERLLGVDGMLDQLNALPDPTDIDGASASAFGKNAATIISGAYNDVTKLYNTYARGKVIPAIDLTGANDGFGGGFGGFGNGYIPQAGVTDVHLNYVPTFLNGYGFNNTLLGLGANTPTFNYGTEQYGQSNGLPLTGGFNSGFNTAFTKVTGLNYKAVRPVTTGLF